MLRLRLAALALQPGLAVQQARPPPRTGLAQLVASAREDQCERRGLEAALAAEVRAAVGVALRLRREHRLPLAGLQRLEVVRVGGETAHGADDHRVARRVHGAVCDAEVRVAADETHRPGAGPQVLECRGGDRTRRLLDEEPLLVERSGYANQAAHRRGCRPSVVGLFGGGRGLVAAAGRGDGRHDPLRAGGGP